MKLTYWPGPPLDPHPLRTRPPGRPRRLIPLDLAPPARPGAPAPRVTPPDGQLPPPDGLPASLPAPPATATTVQSKYTQARRRADYLYMSRPSPIPRR